MILTDSAALAAAESVSAESAPGPAGPDRAPPHATYSGARWGTCLVALLARIEERGSAPPHANQGA